MRLTIFEAIEVGLFEVPFHPDNPFLFYSFWICLLLSMGIQFLLFKKCKTRLTRWSFVLISLTGFFICEIGCQIITGWDLILWLLLWFLFLTFLLGAGICTLLRYLHKKLF